MSLARSVFVGLIMILVLAALVIIGFVSLNLVAQKKAVKKLTKMAKDYHIPISKYFIRHQVSQMNFWDLKKLDDWTTAIENKDKAEILRLTPDVIVALKKTDLGNFYESILDFIS